MKRPAVLNYLALLAILSVSLSACARHHAKNQKPSAVPTLVGEIELVNAGAGFVLIETGLSGGSANSGAEVITRDANGSVTAHLRITPERRSSFLAADILSGKPNQGDRVYQ